MARNVGTLAKRSRQAQLNSRHRTRSKSLRYVKFWLRKPEFAQHQQKAILMERFPIHTLDSAPEASKSALRDV